MCIIMLVGVAGDRSLGWPRQKGGQLIERSLLLQRNVFQLTLDNRQTVPSAKKIVGVWPGKMLRIKFDRLEKWQLG